MKILKKLRAVIGGFLLSILVISSSIFIDLHNAKSDFKADIQNANRLFLQQAHSIQTILISLAGLYHASDKINDTELINFSEKILKAHPFINTIIRIEKVEKDPEKIKSFEKRMHYNGFINLKLKTIEHTESSPFYLPINLMEPSNPSTIKLLGSDLYSIPNISQTINSAIDTSDTVASDIIHFLNQEELSILVFKPFYAKQHSPKTIQERYNMLDGLFAIKITIKDFINHLHLPLLNLKGDIKSEITKDLSKTDNEYYTYKIFQGKMIFQKNIYIHGRKYQYELTRDISFKVINVVQIATLLILAITFYVFLYFTIKKKKASEEKIKYLAYYDSLTKLPNRHSFEELVKSTLNDAVKNSTKGAILFMDLDDFKRINDTFGHKMGDELLIQFSMRLKKQTRENSILTQNTNKRKKDFITRLGGDEFIILLANINDYQSASIIANRILEDISQPFNLFNHKIFVSVSIGIAIFPFDGQCVDKLLKHADTAMYYAKERGKNNFQFYETHMSRKIQRRLDIESKLRQAIHRNEFCLYYQPQINTQTNKIVAAEALIRWNQPELGLIYPDEFISIAEETSQILVIGEWVINEACKQSKKWQDAGYEAIRIAINLSGRQFSQSNLSNIIKNALQENNLQPEHIELEITESIMMSDTEETISTIYNFNDIGLGVSVDDFGTGHSSLSYLKKFPLESLKIDRSFVSDIPHDKDDMMITSAIILMAKSLDLKVVAEGVENQEQIDFLKKLNCDLLQGYFFSKPMPVHEFQKLLDEQETEFTQLPILA